MTANNLITRPLFGFVLFVTFSFSIVAQTNNLGNVWKASAKSPSENIEKGSVATEATAPQIQSAALPNEPTVQPANPALSLEAEVSVLTPSKLETRDDATLEEELVGVEPPATFEATAYSLRGITRSGAYTRRGVIAADPRVLPLGSVVHLKAGNYSGVYTVKDTGGAIKGKKIDVWMPSTREARTFGRRNVKLTVLKYGKSRKAKGTKGKG